MNTFEWHTQHAGTIATAVIFGTAGTILIIYLSVHEAPWPNSAVLVPGTWYLPGIYICRVTAVAGRPVYIYICRVTAVAGRPGGALTVGCIRCNCCNKQVVSAFFMIFFTVTIHVRYKQTNGLLIFY